MVQNLTEQIAELKSWLSMDQPGLNVSLQDDFYKVYGSYIVKPSSPESAAFGPLGRFDIQVRVFVDHPERLPLINEMSGRITVGGKNHANGDGTLCYGPPALTWAANPDMNLIRFFKEYVRSYFLGYLHYEETGLWPKGEYTHGNEGVLTAFSEILNCAPNLKVINGLLVLLTKKHRRDRLACHCQSGDRLGECCRTQLNIASKTISREKANMLLTALYRDLWVI